jgi:hypothetical protein
MPEVAPPLTAEHIDYLERAASILVGTCSADLAPEGIRAVGLRVHPSRTRVSVLVPSAIAGRTLDNLTAGPRIAVTTAASPTFSTIQLKGLSRGVRDGDAADRTLAEAFLPKFEAEFSWADLARSVHIATWPLKVIDLDIESIHVEAPAPLDFATPKPRT